MPGIRYYICLECCDLLRGDEVQGHFTLFHPHPEHTAAIRWRPGYTYPRRTQVFWGRDAT